MSTRVYYRHLEGRTHTMCLMECLKTIQSIGKTHSTTGRLYNKVTLNKNILFTCLFSSLIAQNKDWRLLALLTA